MCGFRSGSGSLSVRVCVCVCGCVCVCTHRYGPLTQISAVLAGKLSSGLSFSYGPVVLSHGVTQSALQSAVIKGRVVRIQVRAHTHTITHTHATHTHTRTEHFPHKHTHTHTHSSFRTLHGAGTRRHGNRGVLCVCVCVCVKCRVPSCLPVARVRGTGAR